MTIEKIEYKGWPNSYRVSNGEVEAVVTGDVGPRIIRFGFSGGQNFFKEFADQLGRSGESSWQPRGGHRLWVAPEDRIRTYALDNGPVNMVVAGDTLEAIEPVEPLTGIEKRMVVRMEASGTRVVVDHRIRNASGAPVELAPWAPTMMAPGGYGIHGFPPRGTHPEDLDASSPLVTWTYTNFADPRWKLLRKYLVLCQDPGNSDPQKLGCFNRDTWGAYLLNDELFVKRTRAEGPIASYTDNGCSFETFTNADFLEMETLGPLTRLAPGETVTHTEYWSAHRGVEVRHWTDEELDRVIAPLVG